MEYFLPSVFGMMVTGLKVWGFFYRNVQLKNGFDLVTDF